MKVYNTNIIENQIQTKPKHILQKASTWGARVIDV